MKTFAGVSDALDQMSFHEAVNVLMLCRKFKLSFVEILTDSLEPLNNAVLVLMGEDTLIGKHSYMSDASLNVLMIKLLVKGK